jgi:hypothetical protein
LSVLDPGSTYVGLTYGDWCELWSNSFAEDFSGQSGPVYFLRGSKYSTTSGTFLPFRAEGSNAITITKGTALFFPILTTTIHTGAFPNLNTDALRRAVVRKEMSLNGTVFCKMWDYDQNKEVNVLADDQSLQDYKIESPKFTLEVPDQRNIQPLLWELTPLVGGSYEAVCGGIFLLITDLVVTQKGRPYRFHYGGTGDRDYRTEAFCEIIVAESVQAQEPDNDFTDQFSFTKAQKVEEMKVAPKKTEEIKTLEEIKQILEEIKKKDNKVS